MQISLNWLKEFVKIPKEITPEDLRGLLTMHTVEVEDVIKESDKYANVIVGKILEIEKHPNADRLQLAKVDLGGSIANIVCGASNILPGQLVPVALPGAILPNGAEIKEAEVRGVVSSGMLCALDELKLGDDHSGIMLLDNKAKIGKKLSDYLQLDDTILDIDNKSLSNRPDLWCHRGIAREIAAITETEFLGKTNILSDYPIENTLKITVKDQKLCQRYMAIQIDGIKVAPSPDWIKNKILAVGLRPINNIVDITNYVMYELGQPLHAFDCGKIDEIIVRLAGKNEEIETLDGKTRKLDENMLVIADSQKAIAIAGVMGSANSEIDSTTVSLIIESANFNFSSIRKTSVRLSLRTDASARYEKALDPNLCSEGLARAIELILQVCPEAKVNSKIFDQNKSIFNQEPINISYQFINERIGVDIPADKVDQILFSLGFSLTKDGDNLQIIIPSWRATRDISAAEDIVEEVLRIYGFDKVPNTLPIVALKPTPIFSDLEFIKKVKNILAQAACLTETYNYSFVGEEQLKKLGINPADFIALSNPLSSQQTLLRQSLSVNLLENIKTNQARYAEISVFEIGQVFLAHEGDLSKDNQKEGKLPYQERRLGIVLAGSNEADIFNALKSVISLLLIKLNLPVVYTELDEKLSWMDAKRAAKICLSNRQETEVNVKLGYLGVVSKKICKTNGIKKAAAVAEIYLEELYNQYQKDEKTYAESDKFPSLDRDLAFLVDKQITFLEIKKAIYAYHSMISKVNLFDVYEDEKIGRDKKSLAFHIVYQANRTLTSEEVDKLQTGLCQRLEEKFGAVLRDF